MLILTRKTGDSVMIGDDVSVTVLAAKGNQVRIGIKAPKHLAVHREEIYRRIKVANRPDHEQGTDLNFSSSTLCR